MLISSCLMSWSECALETETCLQQVVNENMCILVTEPNPVHKGSVDSRLVLKALQYIFNDCLQIPHKEDNMNYSKDPAMKKQVEWKNAAGALSTLSIKCGGLYLSLGQHPWGSQFRAKKLVLTWQELKDQTMGGMGYECLELMKIL